LRTHSDELDASRHSSEGRVELPHVVVVEFQNGKIAHEHIYWDQGSLLAQIGLLDSQEFPVAAIEIARKLLSWVKRAMS